MADNTKLISDLPPLSELRDDDVLFCMRGSISYKLPGSVVKTLALGGSAYIGYYGGAPYWYIYDPDTGGHVRSEKAQGPEGPRITGAEVDVNYHLIITLDDGTEYDAGYVRGPGGAGTGDMLEEDYDPTGAVKAAGGIAEYVGEVVKGNMSETSEGDVSAYAYRNGNVVVCQCFVGEAASDEVTLYLDLPYRAEFAMNMAAAVYPGSSLYASCHVRFESNWRAALTIKKELSYAESLMITFTYICSS